MIQKKTIKEIDKFAKLCKTIPNEIMTSIGKRVYRKYE